MTAWRSDVEGIGERGDQRDAGAARFVVVGVDGSEPSVAAVRWAAEQARRLGAEMRAVMAWDTPTRMFLVPEYSDADFQRHAADLLDSTLFDALGPEPDVPVHAVLVQDRAGPALAAAAEGAELLVVGAHGRGELPGVHLGSVASYCVHHASCPVVVLRGRHHIYSPVGDQRPDVDG